MTEITVYIEFLGVRKYGWYFYLDKVLIRRKKGNDFTLANNAKVNALEFIDDKLNGNDYEIEFEDYDTITRNP